MFDLPHLQHMTLDYFLTSSESIGGDHDYSAIHLPSLASLCITFDMAYLLFDNDHLDTLFPHDGPTAFPSLTHLKLVKLPQDPSDSELLKNTVHAVPELPLAHMPRLAHVDIPALHQGFVSKHYVTYSQLRKWASRLAHVTSICMPGVVKVKRVPRNPIRLIFSALTSLDFSLRLCPQLENIFAAPNLKHLTMHARVRELPKELIASSPMLESVTLHAWVVDAAAWVTLASLPNLRVLAIVDQEPTDSKGLWFPALEPNDVGEEGDDGELNAVQGGPLITFEKLETLSFSMAPGSLDFVRVAFPNLQAVTLDMEHNHIHPFMCHRTPKIRKMQLSTASHLCRTTIQRLMAPSQGDVFLEWVNPLQSQGLVDNNPSRIMGWCMESNEQVREMVLHYTGQLGNRSVWRAMLDSRIGLATIGNGQIHIKVSTRRVGKRQWDLMADVVARLITPSAKVNGKGPGLELASVQVQVANEDLVHELSMSRFAELKGGRVQVVCNEGRWYEWDGATRRQCWERKL